MGNDLTLQELQLHYPKVRKVITQTDDTFLTTIFPDENKSYENVRFKHSFCVLLDNGDRHTWYSYSDKDIISFEMGEIFLELALQWLKQRNGL